MSSNTQGYLLANRDVAQAGINPFVHYVLHGYAEGRNPNPRKEEIQAAQMHDDPAFEEFFIGPAPENGVLMVEANNCHGEILPGYAHYLLDLGYAVDAIITPEQAALDPFCRLGHPNFRIFTFPFPKISYFLQNAAKIHGYEFTLFTSYTLYKWLGEEKYPSIYDHFPNMVDAKHGIVAVSHHFDLMDGRRLSLNRVIVLDKITSGKLCIVNPHYFGEVKITAKSKNMAHFIVVGALDEPTRRNLNLLIEAALQLIKDHVENFFVTLIGRGNIEIPPEISKHFHKMGSVAFNDMYNKMEDADFLLPLFDPEMPEHDRYLTTATSGSYQLCYGFHKPCVIAAKFAPSRGLNRANSVIYDNSETLASAMKRAIGMNQAEYADMQEALGKFAESIYKMSKDNMDNLLKKLKNA